MRSEKKIIVTGGAGFLGSHLCERLIHAGHSVICVDNFCTGSLENIAHLKDKLTLIQQDICVPLSLSDPIDEIYNLACPASPKQYQINPLMTLRTCVEGSTQLLEFARKKGAKILQASTSEVYGDPTMHPQKEEYWGNVNPIGIRSCYDEGKRCAETLFFDYQRMYGLDIKVARIFNTFGPRMQEDDGRVVSNFINQAIQDKPITIYGTGNQTRSFCYVDDLISGLIALMESPFSGPVNLGNPQEYTITELAELILELTKSKSTLEYKPLPQDDPQLRCPDITKAKEWLHWHPRVNLIEGLHKTIDYFFVSQ